MSNETLFIFSGLNPLDNVPLKSIINVEIIEDRCFFNTIDDNGKKVRIERKKTDFIQQQITGFNLETNEL